MIDREEQAPNPETLLSYKLSTMCGECPSAWTLFGGDSAGNVTTVLDARSGQGCHDTGGTDSDSPPSFDLLFGAGGRSCVIKVPQVALLRWGGGEWERHARH
mmetsp:Transcript_70729/g.142417  ORF Transcript_70729/g.142417 Transcript_70729/m.142417 type:complete len:102 (-) Transcript_70729:754-1059(-)